MKTTIYELLGLVKDKVDIDTYIRYYDKLDNKTDVMLACKENIIYNLDRTSIELNDEVEILEEKKIPEKIEYYDDSIAWVIDDVGQLSDVDKVIIDKLNEVIDCIKMLENK